MRICAPMAPQLRPRCRRVLLLALLLVVNRVDAESLTPFTAPYELDDHTVALYHFDDTAEDVLGNHPGTLYGDAGFVDGLFGRALSVDGDGDYVRLGNVHLDPVRDTSEGTIEMWLYFAAKPGDYSRILGFGNEYGANYDEVLLGQKANLGPSILFGLYYNRNWQVTYSGVEAASLVGAWHHVAGTWGPRGLEIWIDGLLRGRDSFSGGLWQADYPTMIVGSDSWRGDIAAYIDELRVSDIQRSYIVPEPSVATGLFLATVIGLVVLGRRKRVSIGVAS